VLSPAAEPETAAAPSSRPAGTVISIGDTPEGVVVDDVTHLAVVALRRPDELAFVDLRTRAIRRVTVPGRARHLRLARPGGPVLLPGEDSDVLAEIGLPQGTVLSSVHTRRQPHDAVAAGNRIWVTDELAASVSAIGPGGRTLPGPVQPGGLAAAGGRVAAADVRGNKLYVYDATSLTQVAVLPAGEGPTHVVEAGGSKVLVADSRGDAVLLYDLAGAPRLLDRLPLAGGPYGLAADLRRGRVEVALSGRNLLVGVDVVGDKLQLDPAPAQPTMQQPNSVAVDEATGHVVVAGATPKGELQLLDRG
jgi:DNA-binding beta-propeller fold protein YncE